MIDETAYVHALADVSPDADVGAQTRIWRFACIREHAQIGAECTIGQGVYMDPHVRVGSRVKVQTNSSLFEGVVIDDGVFIGPHTCFTNDLYPRAITLEGAVKGAAGLAGHADARTLRRFYRRWVGHPLRRDHRRLRASRRRIGGDARRATVHARHGSTRAGARLCLPLRPTACRCACRRRIATGSVRRMRAATPGVTSRLVRSAAREP